VNRGVLKRKRNLKVPGSVVRYADVPSGTALLGRRAPHKGRLQKKERRVKNKWVEINSWVVKKLQADRRGLRARRSRGDTVEPECRIGTRGGGCLIMSFSGRQCSLP